MAEALEELPLFPLDTVLFPYANLLLHVFEERYKEMVQMCLSEDRPFGVVLIREGSEVGEHAEPYLVGTVVRVEQTHAYDDGRMDLQVRGQRRFRIRRIDESKPYLLGYVEPIVEFDLDESDRGRDLVQRAREEFTEFIRAHFSSDDFTVQVQLPPDPTALSFTIASFLPMENLAKQRLLESTDTLERLEEILPLLRAQILEAPASTEYRLTAVDRTNWITPN